MLKKLICSYIPYSCWAIIAAGGYTISIWMKSEANELIFFNKVASNLTVLIWPALSRNSAILFLFLKSQSFTTLSSPPETARRESGLSLTDLTQFVCPVRENLNCCLLTSQSFTVLSSLNRLISDKTSARLKSTCRLQFVNNRQKNWELWRPLYVL